VDRKHVTVEGREGAGGEQRRKLEEWERLGEVKTIARSSVMM
jgi:hypothetical protein